MTIRSALLFIAGFFISYIIAMISTMIESIPFMAIAFTVFGIYIIVSVYFVRKYRVR